MASNMALQDMLPLPVKQIAAAHRLGAFLKAYNASLVRSIIGALVFLAGAALFFAAGSPCLVLDPNWANPDVCAVQHQPAKNEDITRDTNMI